MSWKPASLLGASLRVLAVAGLLACSIVAGDEPAPSTPAAAKADPPAENAAAADAPADNIPVEGAPSDDPRPEAAPADAAPAQPAHDAAKLVAQLGDESYQVRHDAAQQLAQIGLSARQALLDGLGDSDLEVKRSCRRILADVLEADYQRRLQKFIDDKEGSAEHDLPAWSRYRELIGEGEKDRALFIEMQKAEAALLESYEAGRESAVEALRTRLNQIATTLFNPYNGQRHPPPKGSVAAMLFVATDPDMKIPTDLAEHNYWQNIIQLSPMGQTLSGDKSSPEQRSPEGKLFGRWLLLPGSLQMAQRKMVMAVQYNAPEGLAVATRIINEKKNNVPYYRAMAVAAIGKLADKSEALTLLPPLLEDKSLCQQQRKQIAKNKAVMLRLELRDVALAWLVHLTGQQQRDYFRPDAKAMFDQLKQNQNIWQTANSPGMYFHSNEDREKAFGKWNKWVADHPLAEIVKREKEKEQKEKQARAGDKQKPDRAAAAAAQRAVAFGGMFLPPAVAMMVPAQAGQQAEAEQDQDAQLARADRNDVQKVVRAARLIEDRAYSDAAYLLDQVLTAGEDFTYQPQRGIPLQRGLKVEAERLLGSMPEEGRRAYRLLSESSAGQLLAAAVESGDEKSLIDAVRGYFHTHAGAEATYLLGTHYLNSGHPLRGALCLERLRRRSHDYADFEPALSVKLAACWSLAGLPQLAEQVLQQLKAGPHAPSVDLAGSKLELFRDRRQALTWLASVTGTPGVSAQEEGWMMYRGDASRNLAAHNGNPFLKADLLSPTVEDAFVAKKVAALQTDMIHDYQAQLPSLHPLVVGDTILLRTATAIRALDFETGELRWESPFEDALRHLVEHHNDSEKQRYSDFLRRGLKLRLWQDSTFGTMSSDGRLVFGVEELPFGLGGDYRRLVVMPDGRRRLDPGTQKGYNLLTAYDIETGKIRWEAGGIPGAGEAPLDGAYFLGPPLPMGGRLYVVAEVDEQARLIELEAATGRPVWQLGLTERTHAANAEAQRRMMAQMGVVPPDLEDRIAGASPSCADGVLVCPLSENEYAAVDLTTRTVMWLYTTYEEDANPRMMMGFNPAIQKKALEALQGDDNRWADSSVTIAGDSVLLTPGDSDKLFCLGLDDGKLRWTVPKHDGFYVAGAEDGRVLVVGRSSVWALNLSDGKPAWPREKLTLPPGSVPCGRGYLGESCYFLPLSTAEVARIDLAQGKLLSRSRALDSAVPGNLVRFGDAVLSQGVDGLRRFATLEARLPLLDAGLADNPDDPELLADRGQTLLYTGRISEAVELLERAHGLKPDARINRLLADALVEGLRTDYERFAERALAFEPVDGAPQRMEFLKQLALALKEAGRLDEAFATLLKLADAQSGEPKMFRVSHDREIRSDRWLAARLHELWSSSAGEQRAAIDRLAAAQLEEKGPEKFLARLSRHPLADRARLEVARRELAPSEKGADLATELRLVRLLESDDRQHRGAATALLAGMLHETKRPGEADLVDRALRADLADVVCLDGKTGRELAAEFPENQAARRDASFYWPEGVAKKNIAGSRASTYNYPITLRTLGGPFLGELSLEIDQSGRKLIGYDSLGRKRVDMTLPQNNYIVGSMFSYARGFALGHYLVVWTGNRVSAIDLHAPGSGKLLWSHVTMEPPQNALRNRFFFMMNRRFQMPRQVNGLPGSDPLPMAVASDAVFFQEMDKLTAVDRLTGKVLWVRERLEENSDLLADDDLLFVQQPNEEQALVLSTLDGRELGRRTLPEASRRVAARGRDILTWGDEQGEMALALTDIWSGEQRWQRRFSSAARVWLVSEDDVAVLDGHTLNVYDVARGSVSFTATLQFDHQADSIVVAPSAGGYLVAVNRDDGKWANMLGQMLSMTSAEIHGPVFGLDGSGKTLWKVNVQNQMLRINQPSQVPVVSFLNESQVLEGNSVRRRYDLLCLDRRNGKELHKAGEQNKSNRQLEIEARPDQHTVRIKTSTGSVEFKFGE